MKKNNDYKRNRSRITPSLALLVFAVLMGCSNLLDKNPQGKLNETVFTTKLAVDKLLIACYSPLNGYINGVWGVSSGPDNIFSGDLCSGNIHKGSTPGDLGDWMDIERFTATSDNGRLRDKWVLCYGAIERCNDVLRTLRDNEISDLSESEKQQIIAETKFLRGYYHFEAKIYWNMVPYIDENVEDPQRRVPNDKNIWSNIEADFLFASETLPDIQQDPGRPTKIAAQAFLAKTYLYQSKYAEAKVLLDRIISRGKHRLSANYFDNFNVEHNNGVESVWANQVAVNVPGAGYNRSQRFADLSFPNAPDQPNISGAGFCQPTFDLVNAYQTDHTGLPLIDTYYQKEFKNDMDLESSAPYTLDMTTPVDPRLDWVVGRRGVPYQDWATHPGKDWIRDQISAGPYNQKKYVILKTHLEKYANNNVAKFNALNFAIIRYAQVLLWAAECEVEVGDPDMARMYVNMIRERAKTGIYVKLGVDAPFGDGPNAANYQVDIYKDSWAGKDKDWMRKRVRFEERLELAIEGQFFFDLVRWGIAEEYINSYIGREKSRVKYLDGVVFRPDRCYFPIPQIEIDRSYVNGVPTLTQNPGY